MTKIDLKDRKILYYLDLDSRQSLTQIGKKVGLPKNVVSYRLNRLKNIGVIKNFYTVIDLHKLGYNIFRFYFTYQYATPEIKEEIIDYFLKCKYAGIVHSIEGSFDLCVYMYLKNLPEFYEFWEKTLSKYRDYFAIQVLSVYYQEHMYNCSFLIDEKTNRKKVDAFGGRTRVKIDELDLKILPLLAPNARLSASEIAKQLDVTTVTVTNRIKKLIDLEVIQWFRTSIDFTKLGHRWYKVDIVLKDHKKLPQIMNYVRLNPNFVGINRSLGYVDLELEFYLKNISEVHRVMEDISVKFPDTIRNYKYVYVIETHKYHFFPEV